MQSRTNNILTHRQNLHETFACLGSNHSSDEARKELRAQAPHRIPVQSKPAKSRFYATHMAVPMSVQNHVLWCPTSARKRPPKNRLSATHWAVAISLFTSVKSAEHSGVHFDRQLSASTRKHMMLAGVVSSR